VPILKFDTRTADGPHGEALASSMPLRICRAYGPRCLSTAVASAHNPNTAISTSVVQRTVITRTHGCQGHVSFFSGGYWV
jgi:hypothetical protein